MIEVVFALPGDLATPTGGYAYARRLIPGLRGEGIAVRHLELPGSFPEPSPADLAETARLLVGRPPCAALLLDGLAGGAIPAGMLAPHAERLVALVHHPLAFESGLGQERRRALFESERAALGLARRVVATSRATARVLAEEFGVPRDAIAIAEPGTDPAPRAGGGSEPPLLVSVGAVTPRKGHDILIAALSGLADLPWRLAIAGALDRAPETTAKLQAAIGEAGLENRVDLAGALDDAALADLLHRADLFVSPTRYEGYGMALAEAMARGLPIVTTNAGAAAETVPDDAGLKVPADDPAALEAALRQALISPDLRATLAAGSWAHGRNLRHWGETAARVAKVLREVAGP